MPIKDLCAVGGWLDAETVLTHYLQADQATMERGLAGRTPLRKAAG